MKEQKIKAYLIRVDENTGECFRGSLQDIPNELSFLQSFVNFNREHGLIQVINIEGIDVICEDEGKLKQFPISRVWVEGTEIVDVFVGNLICIRADEATGEFTSIREEDISVIRKYLKPVVPLKNGKAMIIPDETWLEEWKEK